MKYKIYNIKDDYYTLTPNGNPQINGVYLIDIGGGRERYDFKQTTDMWTYKINEIETSPLPDGTYTLIKI